MLSGKLRIFEFYVVFEHISFVFCFSDVFLDFCVFRMCVKYSCYGFMVYTEKKKKHFINSTIPEENGVGGM